jgi:hypothetical protein
MWMTQENHTHMQGGFVPLETQEELLKSRIWLIYDH